MKRFRIALLGQSPCRECSAARSCRQNGHEFAVLLEEHTRSRPFAMDVAIEHVGQRVIEKVLPYVNGRCQFLSEDDRCLIHDDRPMNCRWIQCVEFFYHRGSNLREHGRFLQLNQDVLALLQRT